MDSLYQTLLCVVEQGTLSQAAKRLHTTQPTVTRQIQQLEQLLETSLFERIGKRLVPTPACRRVYDYAQQLSNMEKRMREDLAVQSDPNQGIVRIGAGLTPTIYRIPNLIATYRLTHPNVRFQVVTGSSKVTVGRLLNRDIDVGIVTTPPAEDVDVTAIPLWPDALVVVSSPQHVFANRICTRSQMSEQPMIVMHVDSGLRTLVSERFPDAAETGVQAVVETDSLEAMSRFVQAGLGMAVVPWSAVRDDVHAGRLAIVDVTGVELGARTITAVVRYHGSLPAATAAFVDALPMLVRETDGQSLG